MKGKPFVFLGISGDEDRERLKLRIKEHGINWSSWYDGGPDGPISTAWAVQSWPTVFVLDQNGSDPLQRKPRREGS